jgi:type I restriction enzyme S subunit
MRRRLGEVLEVEHGWAFKGEHAGPERSGLPRLIRIGNFAGARGDRFRPEQPEGYSGPYPDRFELSAGDLLVAMTCQTADGSILGWPMRVPDNGVVYLHNQRIGQIVVTDNSAVTLNYLEYLFRTDELNDSLYRSASGSKILHTAPSRIAEVEHDFPALDEQRRIVEVLSALDDLIDTNEQLANTQTALANAHGQLLLSRFSEGDAGTVDDIATIAKGYSYKSAELVEGGGWLVGLKNVGRRGEFRADGFKPLNAEVKPSQVVENGDLVVAHTDLTQAREVIGRPVRVRRGKREGTLVASLDLAVVRPKPGVSVEYLQAILESPAFREHALGYCNGTTVLHMSSQAVPSFPVVVPTAERMSAFEELSALRAGADDAYDAADELRRIRDELLPLLMSGAVRVRSEGVAA